MKKKLFIFVTGIIFLFLLPIPSYVELNNLAIIESVTVNCVEDSYEVILKEVLPKKEDDGIQYEYKYYEKSGKDLKSIKEEIEDDSSKKFFYNDTKSLATNCIKSDEIIEVFSIHPKRIKHKSIEEK